MPLKGVTAMTGLTDGMWHQLSKEEVVAAIKVDLSKGSSTKAVLERQVEYGRNRVSVRRGSPAWVRFIEQFNQPLVCILLVATGVTALIGELVDSLVIFGIVIINAGIGYLQEAKAEKTIQALAKMVSTDTTVRRGGHKLCVHSEELVPGDVVVLQSGDRVPADLRLVHVRNLPSDETALTG
jgi:Ca2+-transporting ATPase